MKVVFFGTPCFAANVLRHLIENHVKIVGVVSKPDRPKGRSGAPVATPVKSIALEYHLPLFQPEMVSAPEWTDTLRDLDADLFVVVAYGEIIKQHLLEMPRRACINLHASLLPKYRGAAPIQRSIIEGELETGVTIMHMAKKMDAGDMIQEVRVPIGPAMTFGELEEVLCDIGEKALLDVILSFEKGEPLRIPQDHSFATFAPKIELEDCEIDWNRPAQEIHNLVRGVNPYPGAWCNIAVKGEKKRLKINSTRIVSSGAERPGTILNIQQNKGNLVVATADQSLELIDVQLEGKKRMSSEELTRGILRQYLSFVVF